MGGARPYGGRTGHREGDACSGHHTEGGLPRAGGGLVPPPGRSARYRTHGGVASVTATLPRVLPSPDSKPIPPPGAAEAFRAFASRGVSGPTRAGCRWRTHPSPPSRRSTCCCFRHPAVPARLGLHRLPSTVTAATTVAAGRYSGPSVVRNWVPEAGVLGPLDHGGAPERPSRSASRRHRSPHCRPPGAADDTAQRPRPSRPGGLPGEELRGLPDHRRRVWGPIRRPHESGLPARGVCRGGFGHR